MMIPCLWSLLFGFDALTGVGWKGAPAAASFLVDIPRGLGNGIWRKRPYGLRLRIFPQPLGGALKNPNAAPTTPPCFGRWPRSSPLQTKGCSPLIIPKQMGSIQKIQVAPLKDFLCCADLKSLARRNVMATACFHADVNAPAGSQHQQMPFAVTTLPVKKQLRNGRSRFGVANKNTISAIYAQSEAESIPNRLSRFNAPSQNPPARLRRSGGAPVSAPASRRIPGGTVPETAPAPAAVRCRSPSKSRTSRW